MQTVCIQVGNRFFCGFGKGGRLCTAWHLAGAKLFMWGYVNEDLDAVEIKLKNKGVAYAVRTIEIRGGV